jgi:hypothetical protein
MTQNARRWLDSKSKPMNCFAATEAWPRSSSWSTVSWNSAWNRIVKMSFVPKDHGSQPS